MPIEQKKLESLIADKFPESKILVEDLAGDNNHYSVTIESSKFNGLSRICLLYTSPSPRDATLSRMPSSA